MNLSWLDFPKISPSPKYKTSFACLGRRGVDTLQQQGLYLRSLPILLPNIPPLYLSWETFLFLPSWGIKPVLLAWDAEERILCTAKTSKAFIRALASPFCLWLCPRVLPDWTCSQPRPALLVTPRIFVSLFHFHFLQGFFVVDASFVPYIYKA